MGSDVGVRERGTGERVWVFDPHRIVHAEQTWWWDPLRGLANVEEAHRLAGHFVQEIRGERGGRDFWSSAAHDLLAGLLLAAAVALVRRAGRGHRSGRDCG